MNKFLATFMMILAAASFSLPVLATGFSDGDQFSTFNIEGRLNIQCSGQPGPNHGFAICREQILTPGEYSYFEGSKVAADQVTLQATREDGSVSKPKTEEYDSFTGKSKNSFNLWVRTLFQRPLLGFGKNIVKYSLKKNGNAVEEGQFVVNVTEGQTAFCQRIGYYTSNSTSDCETPSTYCPRYFQENNYCQ